MTPDIEKLVSDLRASGTRNLPKNNSGIYMSICDKAADALASLVREREALTAVRKEVARLNVTDEELLNIRNRCEKDGDVRIWARMVQKLADHAREIRALTRSP